MESPVLSSAQMQAAEQAVLARGTSVEALMDQAGIGIARAVRQFFPIPGTCIAFSGKGHNGGDALVAAEHLQRIGWKVDLRLPFLEENCSELTHKKLKALRESTLKPADTIDLSTHTVILDGLLGTGAKSFLREPIRSAAREIHRLRREENAFVFAVDLPTGLDADSGENDPEDSVVADITVTIGYAKHGLIVDSALDFVGRIEVVPLPGLWSDTTAPNELVATPGSLGPT
ncbi:MAG TPA: NAD(P)H-hydrate epimerase, partial [Chthoniobacterales bacterium]|nr:NAD(P)H-hydrate epimerase [Chthoniobacterales bacterium]